MDHHAPEGHEIGVALLLAGSDAFAHLAAQLASVHEDLATGSGTLGLDRLQRMSELAGWWCGRLEAEADYAAGLLPELTEAAESGNAPPSAKPDFHWRSMAAPTKASRRCRQTRP